ncbi:MAG: hypothetical protein IKV18_08500 [Alistipes sp.]|nr:hypothetical protein [Alistipes sp.]
MRQIIGFIILSLWVGGCSPINRNCAALCGDNVVKIIDTNRSEGDKIAQIWQWDTEELTVGLPAEYAKYLYPLDECKFVDNNRKLLLTSSHSATVLIDIKSRKCLFYARTPMAHSAELLPNERIAVALSTHKLGNSLELYDIDSPEKVIWKDSLYSGHGVVWNAKRESLYALGYDVLREYKLKDWQSDNPSLEKVAEWPIPVRSGHDLSKVDDRRILVSGHEGVYVFDVESGEFSPFEPLKTTKNVKSVNYCPKSQRLIYTKAEKSWWTHNVYQQSPDKVITIDDWNIYKVRTPNRR